MVLQKINEHSNRIERIVEIVRERVMRKKHIVRVESRGEYSEMIEGENCLPTIRS